MNARPNGGDMPLHCNICPKKPDFSDVSHLLTHVASKGHLSNYFKTQVKASQDDSARTAIDDYDTWYTQWNVQNLMQERMSQKEKKKGGTGNTPRRSVTVPSVSRRSTPGSLNNPNTARRASGLRENVLDPQLDRRVKDEASSRSATPNSIYSVDPTYYSRGFAPHMIPTQGWAAPPYDASVYTPNGTPMKQESFGSSNESYADEESEADTEPRRSLRRSNRRNLSNSTESLVVAFDDEFEMDETIVDKTRMKGVFWTGMAMFDSATPDMKRKRNQKKAFSVVQQLQATSGVIQPEEFVLDAEWNHRKTRTITGNPEYSDDESPLEGETTPEPEQPAKKKATRRPRQPLAEKSANTGRILRRRGGSHHPEFNASRGPYFDGPDDDDELTFGVSRPKKRSGLSIHRDNSGPDITFNGPSNMNEPSAFGLLTAAFAPGLRNTYHGSQGHFQDNHHPFGQANFNRGNQRPPSFGNFRPAQAPNMGSFGMLNSQAMFQPNVTGHHAVASFQHQFGHQQFTMGAHPFGNEDGSFHPANPFSAFGHNYAEVGAQNPPDAGFVPGNNTNANNDLSTVNPLFFSSNQPSPEDDDATVSPPPSDR